MVTDSWGRPVTSLRIQLNAICNFKCIFCHMEGTPINGSQMEPSEIESVLRTAARFGVRKVKFTGGEPLLRRDIAEIIRRTRSIILGDISLTTNGTLLKNKAKILREAGLDRINISLHSIEPGDFQFITGTDSIDKVREGIREAKAAGFRNIKLNFVVLKGINVDQIPKMIDFCAHEDLTLQLIEYETTRENENSDEYLRYHYSIDGIENDIRNMAIRKESNDLHLRPIYTIMHNGKECRIEVVKPMHNAEFCMNCTRLRLTSDGKLKTCLMRDDNYIDILPSLKSKGNIDDLYVKSIKLREPYWKYDEGEEHKSEIFCKVPGVAGNRRRETFHTMRNGGWTVGGNK
ncbi:MAG: GTP 3',8-cyclase MoaA [Candidatus Thermoplasmatota archaeon]|nr:GTP 3',8-cyclase MoaA [Candidatus Thermoplasmatota archaeon]